LARGFGCVFEVRLGPGFGLGSGRCFGEHFGRGRGEWKLIMTPSSTSGFFRLFLDLSGTHIKDVINSSSEESPEKPPGGRGLRVNRSTLRNLR
jgi:hypothetical protein